jgi:hypothetical protein
VEDPFCPLCGDMVESACHALWDCTASRAVWSECSPRISKCNFSVVDYLSLFEYLSSGLEREELEYWVFMAQRIWHKRNRFVFEGLFTPPTCLLKCATEDFEDYRKISCPPVSLGSQSLIRVPIKWSPPPPGVVKINWDAFVDKSGKLMGMGILARDHRGKVLGAMCLVQRYISDAATAEALGARRGAELGRFMGLQSLILEGDALEMGLAIQRDDEGTGSYGNLTLDTKAILAGVVS